MRHAYSPNVSGRVASTNELDAIDFYPCVVTAPEAPLLHQLPHEHNDTLCPIGVLFGQVDLITEDYQPALRTQAL